MGAPAGPSAYGDQEISQFRGAELIAEKWGLTREAMEAFALESHARAIRSAEAGDFDDEIVEVGGLTRDEGPRPGTTAEKLAGLQPLREGGRLTAALASQVSDGAAALLVASERAVEQHGLTPLARVHTMAVVGSDPVLMLTGPIPATEAILDRSGVALDDIGSFEVNEAFASIPMAWLAETGADPARTNPQGGAIALGHPLGGTGARLMTTLLHRMRREGQRYGLQTMCEGGGMANATLLELRVTSVQDKRPTSERGLIACLSFAALTGAIVAGLGSPIIYEVSVTRDVSIADAQWGLIVTLIVGAVCTPVLSRLADGRLRRNLLVGALLVVTVGSLLAVIPTFGALMTARSLQGFGYAMVPLTVSIAREQLDGALLAKTLGVLSTSVAVGVGLGNPAIGLCFLVADYRLAFLLAAAVSGAAAWWVWRRVPSSSDLVGGVRVDLPGALLLGGGLTASLLVIARGNAWGWGSGPVLVLSVVGVVLLAGWVLLQLRLAAPLVDLRLATAHGVLGVNVAAFLLGMGIFGGVSVVVLVAQSPTDTGFGLGYSVFVYGLADDADGAGQPGLPGRRAGACAPDRLPHRPGHRVRDGRGLVRLLRALPQRRCADPRDDAAPGHRDRPGLLGDAGPDRGTDPGGPGRQRHRGQPGAPTARWRVRCGPDRDGARGVHAGGGERSPGGRARGRDPGVVRGSPRRGRRRLGAAASAGRPARGCRQSYDRRMTDRRMHEGPEARQEPLPERRGT